MRIMYVEDNMVNLALVERVARMGGHTIISHTNGVEALKALSTDQADLILMDIELQGELDGMEVTRRLRARGDKRPIIAVTAYAMRGDKERILESGCDAYLPKPIPIAEFLELLAKYDPANAKPKPVEVVDVIATASKVIRGGTGTAPLSPLSDSQPEPKTAHELVADVAATPSEVPSIEASKVVPAPTTSTPAVADVAATPSEVPSTEASKVVPAPTTSEATSTIVPAKQPDATSPVAMLPQTPAAKAIDEQPSDGIPSPKPEENDTKQDISTEPVTTTNGKTLMETKDD